jgi:hypothetical protein
MNTATKLLAAMRRAQLDWQINDLQTVAHRPIKPIYVRKFVELIDGA